MTIKLAAADLNYLLQQINIGADYSQLTSPLDPLGVREVAGSNNNLAGGFVYNADGSVTWTGNNLHGDWGQADTNFPRIFSTDTPDAPPYGVTYDPVTMQVLKDGNNQPVVDANGQPIIIPADLMTQMMESVVTAPGTSPRTITQLISSSDVDPNSPTYNPAAAAAMEALGGQPVETANSVVGTATTAKMPDPGILGGVPFNEYNVAFGQFFDHGLDFISKGGGYVLIKLSPSDPLYNDNPNPNDPFANTMMLSRAKLANPASDFDIDTLGNAVLKDGVTPQFNNNTGLLIDQSQTYGSHVSINVLVRQYDDNGIATGKLITSAEDMLPTDTGYDKALHDLGTWADMKVNAARIGIGLIDVDVLDAPAIKATATGAITFTPLHMTYDNGTEIVPALYQSNETLAAMAARTGIDLATLEARDPFLRDADGNVLHSNQAVLADMGNGASPMGPMGNILSPMGTTEPEAVPGAGQYNEALLASHYVSGDGRVNENIGLTAVHHVFHEEHNIQVDAIKQAAIDNGSEADWQLPNGAWDTEKLYQAARIITESEYNHIAIDQYVGGLVVLPEFVSYSSDVNMSVSLEFSQAVFRLGHSMLNEKMQVAVADDMGNVPSTPDWTPTYKEIDLFDAFLNPALYGENGASNITMGLLNQQANNIDEFVTSALQQSLVGVGLDLPALNIARGRDVGLPTLNELRQQIFEGLQQNTNGTGSGIAPYTSWEDWGGHLRTPESLANFIAAYGRDNDTFHLQDLRVAYEDATDVSAVSHALHAYDLDGDGVIGIQDMRANGQAIVDAAADASDPMHEAALMFMRGTGSPVYDAATGTWDINNTGNGGDQGFWDIDLWIGGLAEQPLFDGPLGTTFTMVMADFGQKMQDGDRFYYLYRMPVGQHLGDQIIGEQFADLIMRTTGLEHIGDAFGYQSATFILDGTNHDNTYDGTLGVDDQYGINDYFNAIYESLPGSVQAFFLANSTLAPGALYSESTDSDATLIAGSALTVTVDLADQDNQPGQMLAIVDVVVKDAVTGDILAHQDNVLVDNGMHTTILDIPQIAYANNGHGITVEVDNHVGFGTVAVQNVTVTQSEGGGSANDGHIVVAGLEGNDYIVGALGDDYIYGDAGNDVLEGAQGNDHIYGGDGDDWITDYENDDFIHGGDGDDYINAGPGVLDTSHGGNGDDEVHGGDGVDEVFGDDGDDRLYGDGDTDLIMGGDGSDYMDGGDSVDEMFGGNGNDWMRGGVGDDNINGGSGNDLMEGGLGPTANDGDRLNGDTAPGALPVIEFNGDGTEGDMDIASYENVGFGVVANLQDANANGTSSNLLDTYSLVEGLVGSAQDDTLTGADANGTAGNGVNNYLIGGGGNDILTGLGDDAGANGPGSMDFIFGDRVIVDNDLYWIGDDRHDANNVIFTTSLAEFRAETGNKHATASDLQAALTLYANDPQAQGAWHGDGYIQNWYGTGETRVVFSADNGATVTLGHILGDHGAAGTSDTAVYHGNYNENGPSDYSIEYITMNGQQAIKITDLRDPTAIDENGNLVNPDHDGIDILVGVEFAQFANGTAKLSNDLPTLDLHADDGGFVLDNFSPSNNYAGNDGSVNWNGGWNEQGADNNGLGGNITIVNNALNFNSNALNFNSNVLNGEGVERAVDLSGATSATLSFNWSESGADNGENILVQAFNGTSWETIGTLAATSSNATGNPGIPLTAAQIGAHTAIRFEYSETGGNGFLDNNENFYIDNVRIDFTKPVNDGGATGYTAAFTEDGPAVAIAKGPAITDPDSTTISSATIVLTNAMAGDVLAANDANGDGITATGNGTGFRGLTGATTITLTGADSLVAYQAAIERVTFSNTSSTPDETPRVINVTVFDNKGAASNVATATINVVDVPNPVANPDHVVSNNGGSTYVVPDWAFLANDSDPGGGSITVNSVTNGTGLTSVSHSNTSQTISINDNSNGSFDNTFSYDISNASQTSNSATVTVDNINGGNVTGGADADILIGNTSPNAFSGNGGNDIIIAGGGNDTISGGAGDDTIVWNVGDGRDFVDGGDSSSSLDSGTSNATGDKFMVNGNGQYYVYTRAAWLALAGNTTGQLNASTEIVISRNGTTNSNVIAELASIEDLAINTTEIVGTSSGNVSGVTVVGDFTGLLNPNTITINSVDGNIVVDVSQMTSDEHVVLNTGGTYEIISNGSNTVTVNGVAEGGTAAPGDNGATDTGTPTDAAPTDGSGTPADALAVIGGGDETLVGTDGADIILGGDTTRTIHAGGGDDVVTTGDAGVVVQGGGGDDNIDGGAGRDIVFGDDGDDIISSAGGNDKVWGDVGDDVIDSGDGDDQVWGDDGDDVIDAGEGNNLVYGGAGNDDITTGSGNDRVWGDDGADLISTGDGNDRIESGLGEDVIFTGLGSDTIVFRTAAEADGDRIGDFAPGDRIDLHFMDAQESAGGNNSFALLTANAFTAEGQLIVHLDGSGNTVIEGNTDGNLATAEFKLVLDGDHVTELQQPAAIIV